MIEYLKKLADSTDPTASVKSWSYLLAILATVVYLAVSLGLDYHHGQGMTSNWVTSLGFLLATVGGTKAIGPWFEKSGAPAPQPKEDQ